MVISSEEYRRRRDELELRISKMISEGGMAVDAQYFHDQSLADSQDDIQKLKMAEKRMNREGGLDADLYDHDSNKQQKGDTEEDEQLMN